MKRCTGFLVMVLAVACGLGAVPKGAWAQAPSLEQALKDVAAYEFGKSRESLTVVADAVRDSQGNADARKDLRGKLTEILKGAGTLDGKQFACRQLSIIGTDETVPVLAPMLTAKETSDMARYALERIPGKTADKALEAALPKAQEGVKIGIINSLGARRCEDASSELAGLLKNKDANVAGAAIAALGKIGGAKATSALAGAKDVPAELHGVWADAYLLCADKLRAEGKNAEAGKIYEALSAASEPDRIRVAALEGRVPALGDGGLAVVTEALTGDNAKLQAAATKFVREMKGQPATDAFAGALAKLQVPGQVLLLSALADRGDGAALAAAGALAKSPDASVRIAALAAVGKLGNASSVPDLAKAACGAEKAESDAARNSLNTLKGTDVDGAMVVLLKTAEPAVRVELARSLAARNAVTATSALLETAKDADESVRVESFKALGQLATPNEMSALVGLLVSVQGDNARREAESATVAVAKKVADENQRAAGVLEALPKTKDVPARCSLLTVLGQLGDTNGLKPVVAEAMGGKAEVKDAAIRALAGWPKPDALEDLVTLAGKAKEDTHRVLALRGIVRILDPPKDDDDNKAPSLVSDDDRLKYFEKAMKVAQKPEEKKMVLGGLGNVKSLAALDLVRPCLKDAALQPEAGLAAQKIQRSFFKASASANPGEAAKAIDGDLKSRWNSGANQVAGQWFMVDLGAEYEVTKIVLDAGESGADFPRGYQVFICNDPNNPGNAIVEGQGQAAVTEIGVNAVKGRYVKVLETGTAEKNGWSIHEFKVETK